MIEPRYKTTNRDPDANFAIEKSAEEERFICILK